MVYTYDYVKNEFVKRNYELISKEYKNVHTDLEYFCNKHKNKGILKIKFSNFIKGRGCPYCMYENGNPPQYLPEDIVQEETEKLGYIYKGMFKENSRTIVKFICPKHEEKGIQYANWTSIKLKKNSCSYCNGTKRTTEDFKKLVYKINPTIEILGEYKHARDKILCRCSIDNYEWMPYAYNLLSGFGCPKCADTNTGLKRRTSIDFKFKKLIESHRDIEFLNIPERTVDKVKCKCKICNNVWEATYANLTKGIKSTRCPKCSISNSELQLSYILDNWGYTYEHQKKFKDCKDIHCLPFDYYLDYFNVLIEFDGEHHYHPIPRGENNGETDFLKTQQHDKIKTEYCKNNNIPLIRIPYWERDNMEYFLFDEFVKIGILEEIKTA